jgi:hypothetical protein
MSRAAVKATDFLSKMKMGAPADVDAPAAPAAIAEPPTAKATVSRANLKHIGAYLDRETVEKVALLRARLALDNSQLIKLAIERLHATESAKRKFGDA